MQESDLEIRVRLIHESIPAVFLSGRNFPSHTYNGYPPRVGDFVVLEDEHNDWHRAEGVVTSVTWNYQIYKNKGEVMFVNVHIEELPDG